MIRIEMPKGSYKPEFHRVTTNSVPKAHETTETCSAGLAGQNRVDDIRLKRRNLATIAVAFIILIGASLTTWLKVAGSARPVAQGDGLPSALAFNPKLELDANTAHGADRAVDVDAVTDVFPRIDLDPGMTIFVGALPYRIEEGKVEVLIVRTRRDSHWTIPKARFTSDTAMWNTVRDEAFNEAGVRGDTQRSVLGDYVFERGGRSKCVVVLPFLVKQVHVEWPENDRARRWCDQKTAAKLIASDELSELIEHFQPE